MIAGPRPRRRYEPGRHRSATWPAPWPRWPARRWRRSTPGRVAILAPETLLPVLAEALATAGCPWWIARDMRKGGLSEPLVLLAADAANGLEFDSVVVVEPGLIAGETARGLRTLYVALTRPTQRLSVVHLAPLPALDGR